MTCFLSTLLLAFNLLGLAVAHGAAPEAASAALQLDNLSGIANSMPGISFTADTESADDTEELHLDLFLKAEQSLNRKPVWPGYSLLQQPILLYETGVKSHLVGHPAPPPEYKPLIRGETAVFVRNGPLDDLAAQQYDLNYRVNGRDCFALSYDSEQNAPFRISMILPASYDYKQYVQANVRTIVHERFHVHQSQSFSMLPVSRGYPLADADDLALAALEDQALIRALKAKNPHEYARMFVALRRARHHDREAAIRPTEDFQEQLEGLALYVDNKLMGRPGLGHPDASNDVERLVKRLDRNPKLELMDKLKWYETGAAQGYLLDRSGVRGWKEAVSKGRPLFNLTEEAFPVNSADEPSLLQAAKKSLNFQKWHKMAQNELTAQAQGKEAMLKKYAEQSGIEIFIEYPPISCGGKSERDGEIYQIDSIGKLYSKMKIFTTEDEGYKLSVENRPLILGDEQVRFYIALDAAMEIDGKPAPLSDGLHPFQSLDLACAGFSLKTELPGVLEKSARKISIRWNAESF